MRKSKCVSCGGNFPDIDGPVHAYMDSSPGCWAVYGEVLAREYSDPSYFLRLIDYLLMPMPCNTRAQRIARAYSQFVCLFLEHGLTAGNANDAMLEAGKHKHSFTWLEPPASLGSITAAKVVKATTIEEHKAIVRASALRVQLYNVG